MTPWHRELFPPRTEGVHETGSTPLVILPEGTHAIALGKNRMHLIERVQAFFEELTR